RRGDAEERRGGTLGLRASASRASPPRSRKRRRQRAISRTVLASQARAPYRDGGARRGRADSMRLAYTVLTDLGRKGAANEDTVHGRFDPQDAQSVLLVIADGMGGAAAGEVASRMAVETIDAAYFAAREGSPDARLRAAMLAANERIARAGEEE